jgi:hypothetical protein
MRTVLLALCALLLLCLAGCGSNPDEGLATQVDVMDIQVTLPGADWHKASDGKIGLLDSERWENGDGTIYFRVATDPSEVLEYPAFIDAALVNDYIDLMDFPSSTIIKDTTIMGLSAVRIESVLPDSAAYHTIDYVLLKGLQHYYVSAGATNAAWNAGAGDSVYAILDSLKVATGK